MLIAMLTAAWIAVGVQPAKADSLPSWIHVDTLLVTTNHRFQQGYMSGQWGHHLGHLVRTATTGLWFIDDTGHNVYVDSSVDCYQLVGDSAWILQKTIQNPPTIQQNTASVAVGDTIFIYGLNVDNETIVEHAFDTVTGHYTTRTVRYIFPNTNYIGAALSPLGWRVVWWTDVVDNGGPAQWFYSWYDGTTWHPPVSSSVPSNDFSYVFASFLNDTTFWAAGEAIAGKAPDWTYALGVGKVVLGHSMTDFQRLPDSNYTSCDIWTRRATGGVHLLGNGQNADLTYYYLPPGGAWPGMAHIVTNPTRILRGTRFIEGPDGYLYLIISTGSGFKLKIVNRAAVVGPLDIDALPTYDLFDKPGFNSTYAIFPERAETQTAPVGAIDFAFPGNDWDHSGEILWVKLTVDRPTDVRPRSVTDSVGLQPNVPNPFNPDTQLRFSLDRTRNVRIDVFDVRGVWVATLANGRFEPGMHEVEWNGKDTNGRSVGSGVYLCRLRAGDVVSVRRMLLLR